MKIEKKCKRLLSLALTILMLMVYAAPPADAYTPPVTNVKVGLSYGTGAFQSANLANADGYGAGYEFGYYDAQRNFVSTGASTGVTAISVIKDKNVFLYTGDTYKEYREGAEGDIIVGCFHMQLNDVYNSYYEAKSVADMYQSSFVKYDSGQFYVCIGNYTSREAAEAAISQNGIQFCSVNAGTQNTISVVETGTNRILFEFDYGTTYHFGVMPVSANGSKCETWFRGLKYSGGFQYIRQSSGEMAVINVLSTEDYIKGVVPQEMGNTWPLEALKAQACSARTYAMYNINKHRASGFDLCNGEHCQAYSGRQLANANSDRAVDETAGMYITYNGSLCQTYYSASDGGATENVENVWNETLPYLRGVIDPYEAAAVAASKIPNYEWTITYSPEELTSRMRERNYNCSTIVSMAAQYTEVGNVLRVTLRDSNGTTWTISKRDNLNYVLGVPSIRFTVGGAEQPGGIGSVYVNGSSETITADLSSKYAIGGDGLATVLPGGTVYAITGTETIEEVSGEDTSAPGSSDGKVGGLFTLKGTGRGHNVGMSQWGAYAMAEYYNMSYRDIINFYYTGVVIG